MSIGRGGRVHSCRSPADSKKKKKWWKGATIVVYFFFFVLFVFVPACFDFSQQLGWFSFTVKLLYAFLVLFFSGKLCCIEAAGRLVEESFNGKQTSTTTKKKLPSLWRGRVQLCTPGKMFRQSAATLISEWTLDKSDLGQQCLYVRVAGDKHKSSYCRMFLYILLSRLPASRFIRSC